MPSKIIVIMLIMLLILGGVFGYTIYQKYSPLAELAKCGENCVDYKKVIVAYRETPVPDIRVITLDAEKLVVDVPLIIHNPSTKDAETMRIDFDVFMEERHLTKGILPAYELPAKQNTTIWIKDIAIKYEELEEVLRVVTRRHGPEMVREGKANITMAVDLLIYFPIKISTVNIYTFGVPIRIETEVPVEMLKHDKEGRLKEVEERIEKPLPTLPPETTPSPTLQPLTLAPTLPPLNPEKTQAPTQTPHPTTSPTPLPETKDSDGDGIADNIDKCPALPENFNGYQDDDGCPDVKPGLP